MPRETFLAPGFAGRYASTTPCPWSDAEVEERIAPTRDFWIKSHGEANVPPMDLLIAAYRRAWLHHASPRRKRFAPALDAQHWAQGEVNRLIQCWVSKRPDMAGSWRDHAELADWPNRIVRISSATLKAKKAKAKEKKVEADELDSLIGEVG